MPKFQIFGDQVSLTKFFTRGGVVQNNVTFEPHSTTVEASRWEDVVEALDGLGIANLTVYELVLRYPTIREEK